MSEIWNEAEEKIKELARELSPEKVKIDEDILDTVLSKKLEGLKQGKLEGSPIVEDSKVIGIRYYLPVKPDDKLVGRIIGTVAKNEEVESIKYETERDRYNISNVNGIFVNGKRNEPLLYISFWLKGCVKVTCNSKRVAKIVDEIAKELKLY